MDIRCILKYLVCDDMWDGGMRMERKKEIGKGYVELYKMDF